MKPWVSGGVRAAAMLLAAGCFEAHTIDEMDPRDAGEPVEQDARVAADPGGWGRIQAWSSWRFVGAEEMSSFSVSAAFFAGGPPSPDHCRRRTVDSCVLEVCEAPLPARDAGMTDGGRVADAGALPSAATAGTIRVEAAQRVSLRDVGGTYDTAVGSGVLWLAPEPLRVHASGASVPEFQVSLPTPDHVTVQWPSMLAEPFPLSKSEPVIRWAGVPEVGDVVVSLSRSGPASESASVTCAFDSIEAFGVFPREALEPFPIGERGTLTVGVRNRTEVDVGAGWRVEITATAAAVRVESGSPAEATIEVVLVE